MNNRTGLVVGAALGAVLITSAPAQAAPARRHKPATTTQSEILELKQQLADMKARLETLQSRLDAQTAAQQQSQAQIQAAQTQAQAAQTTAQAAQTTAQAAQTQAQADAGAIETLPGKIEKTAKSTAPKGGWWNNGWWGDTKIGGVVFADVSTIQNKNAAGKTAQTGTDYDIKRTYLTVEHRFNDTYSFNFTSDLVFDSNTASPSGAASPTNNEAGGANTASGVKSTQLFVKKAYLQAHYADAFNIRLGSAELPWVPFVEGINGYRFVEQMLIDRIKFGTTTDWGVHVYGTLFDKIIGYQVSVIDGEGFRQPAMGTVNRTNAVDVEGRVNATYDHFTVAVGGYDGKLGSAVERTPTFHDAQRFNALLAYTDSRIRLGAEYLWARYWKDVTQSSQAKTNETTGYSLFGSYNFTPAVSVFGRYDWVRPKGNTTPSEHEDFFDVGVDYKPITALDFALVYKRDSVVNGSFTTSDGVIGIPTGATTGKGTYDEFGLFTQVKF